MKPIQILLLLVLGTLGALVLLQLPELRRYLKIRSM
jgi:uncharacterized protein DUF6893